MNKLLLANIRFYFAQSVFMNNCHYKAYGRLEDRKKLVSNIAKLFSSVTLLLLILQIIGLENDYDSFINILAFVGLVLTGSILVFEIINKEDITLIMVQHRNSAEKYKTLRDEYMSLITDVMSNNTDEEILIEKRDELLKRYSLIGENSPTTTYDDYKNAQESLGLAGNSDEEFTWSNEQIDKFLPEELKQKNS